MRLNFNYRDPKDLFSLFGVLFILITLPLTVIAVLTSREPASKAAGTATMTLVPSTVNVNQNATFTVQIRENSGTDPVNAVQANITFDATKLDFLSWNTTGTAFGIDASSTPDGTSNGTLSTARGVTGGTAPVTGDKLISTATFRAKPGSGTTTITIASTSVIARSTDNTNIFNGTGGTSVVTIVNPPPTVSITSPTSNQVLGGTITVNATASDDVGVTRVEFSVDGGTPTSDTTSPYSHTINSTTLTNASHTITARAFDASTSTPANVTIIVDNLGPTTSITSPTAGALVRGSAVVVTPNATDTNGINRVEFYVDGVMNGSADTTSPYSFTWNSTAATNASHSLTVRAYDNRLTTPNQTTSATVSVTVDNSAPTAPTISCTAPSQTQINLSWTASTDNVGVTGYTLFRNGTQRTTTVPPTTTFNDTTVTAPTVYSYYVVATDGAGNTTQSNTINCSTRKIGDINGDGNVDVLDLSALLSAWGTSNANSDLNGDGTVGVLDLSILLSKWGT